MQIVCNFLITVNNKIYLRLYAGRLLREPQIWSNPTKISVNDAGLPGSCRYQCSYWASKNKQGNGRFFKFL